MTTTPLVSMHGVDKSFGGVHAVSDVSFDLHPGEVLSVLGHNGAGKSCLMKMLSGAMPMDAGEIQVDGEAVHFDSPLDSRNRGIETIYQTLALADNLDAAANLFLGREMRTPLGMLDHDAMEAATRKVLRRLNPNFTNINDPVHRLSGGQRQVIAIGRAIQFDARILIMDEPTAALGPSETEMVSQLIQRLKSEGIGIILVSHDMHDVFSLTDRLMVMKNGRSVGTHPVEEVTQDDVLSLIILGRLPEDWVPRNQ